MSAQPSTPALIPVLCKRNIWVASGKGTKKIQAGTVISLSKEDIKLFGSAVTKDTPEED